MHSFTDLWRQIVPMLNEELGDTAYNTWIKPIIPVQMTASEAVLKVPSSMHRDIIAGRFNDNIRGHILNLTGIDINVRYVVENEAQAQIENPVPEMADEGYEYTFDTFIVGSSNRFAHAAAQAVAQNPGGAYNPLFIYGPSGLGKTHLLFAIRDQILKQNPMLNVVYIKGDQFTNELIEAIRSGQQLEFRNKYRYADVFLMDDIQFIGGKVSTEEEFFHTFNTLQQDRRQIVLTSDRPPREIQTLQDRLRSRFESGLIADIQPPELETRMAIIKRKATQFNMNLDDRTTEFIATRVKANIRQLEGVVKKMNIICMVEGEKPNMNTAQKAIKDIMNDAEPVPMTIERIVEEVARIFDVPAADIYTERRSQPISRARQAAMYCIREITSMSFEAIGAEFGKDHTTVIYAVQKIEELIKDKPEFRAKVEDIIKNVKS